MEETIKIGQQIFMGIFKKKREKRLAKRIPYSGFIFYSTKGGFFKGELKNYSPNGLFIKTNEALAVGDFITVAPPYTEDKLIKYQAQIRWRNREGYGVKLIGKRNDTHIEKREQIVKDFTQKGYEKRFVARKPYSGPVFFSTSRGLFEGVLKNYSKHGLFIKTSENFAIGTFITVALPHMENKLTKLKGQMMWRNSEGYGVELIIKRDDSDHQHRKISAKSI